MPSLGEAELPRGFLATASHYRIFSNMPFLTRYIRVFNFVLSGLPHRRAAVGLSAVTITLVCFTHQRVADPRVSGALRCYGTGWNYFLSTLLLPQTNLGLHVLARLDACTLCVSDTKEIEVKPIDSWENPACKDNP